MLQLQLYTVKNQRGFHSLVNINPVEDIQRNVHDYKPLLQTISYAPAEKQYFIAVKILSQGTLLTVLRPIAGGVNEYYAGAIFFPAGIRMTTNEKINIIESVKEFLNGSDPDAASIAAMRDMLSRSYTREADVPMVRPSSGHHVAYVMYGGNDYPSFEDYASAYFYQPDFSDFGSVVLLDSQKSARGNSEATDLSRKQLEQLVQVNPPTTSANGFAPLLGRRPFTSPVLASLGSSLKITWHKNGFESITEAFKVSADGLTPTAPDTSELRRIVGPEIFHVTGSQDQKLDKNCTIKINGEVLLVPKAFSYSELRDAHVEVSVPGFKDFNGNFDLATTSQVLVKLHTQHKTYRFDLPLNTPDQSDPVRIYIKSKKVITDSPIAGYTVDKGKIFEGSGVTNKLVYTGGGATTSALVSPKMMAIAAAIALLIGFGLGWLVFHSSGRPAVEPIKVTVHPEQSDTPSENVAIVAEPVPESEVVENIIPQTQSDTEALKTAIAYLDGNKTWSREDMEANPALTGLFDEMNTYNFAALNARAEKLSASKNYATLLRAVAGAASKRDPRTGRHNPAFDNDNRQIDWRSYTYWIDP